MASHLDRIIRKASELAEGGQVEEAWRLVEPLSEHVSGNAELASLWTTLAHASPLDESVGATAAAIVRSHRSDRSLTVQAAGILSLVAEQIPFDEAPRADGAARIAADALRGVIDSLPAEEKEDPHTADLYSDLAMALRMTGSEDDEAALEAMHEALRLQPEDGWRWFQLGLIHKWRGRWTEGVEANRRARELGAESESVLWNLAICATGAGFHPLAGSLMKELGMKGTVGEDGLFAGGFDPVQIRVSTLGEGIDPRAHVVGNEPDFEYLWIDRQSLVHGRVMSASVYDLPVDFGDLVLFDGAAIGWRESEGKRVPRFPLLQKLSDGPYRCYRFRAQQPRSGFLDDLREQLPEATFFYVHDEQVNMLCRECAAAGKVSHDHEHSESSFVSGKLVVHEESFGEELVRRIDALLGDEALVAMPQLHLDLGNEERAKKDDALWEELDPDQITRNVVVCEAHGSTEPTFVCSHLVEGEGLGFFAASDDESERADAWCRECERVRIEEGGEWNDRSEAFAAIRMICSHCYDAAKQRNARVEPKRDEKRHWWKFWGD